MNIPTYLPALFDRFSASHESLLFSNFRYGTRNLRFKLSVTPPTAPSTTAVMAPPPSSARWDRTCSPGVVSTSHDDVTIWKSWFPSQRAGNAEIITGPLWGESTGNRCIPCQASPMRSMVFLLAWTNFWTNIRLWFQTTQRSRDTTVMRVFTGLVNLYTIRFR